jgi:hypothetical protein
VNTARFLDPSAQQGLRERELLVEVLASLPPRSQIVELGTAEGGNALLLAAAGRAAGHRVATIDRRAWPERDARLGSAGVEPLCGDTSQPQSYWPAARRADFLLIDADHSWFGVRADLEAWLPFAAPKALVLFHDVSPVCPGEFLYVWERIFRGELAPPCGTGTLLGGRLAPDAARTVPSRPALSIKGTVMLRRLLDADLDAWPDELASLQPPHRFPLQALVAGSEAEIEAATWALRLERPALEGDAPILVVTDPPAAVIAELVQRGVDRRRIVPAFALFKEALLERLWREQDDRLWSLFPSELRAALREILGSWPRAQVEALLGTGSVGRVRLSDFASWTTLPWSREPVPAAARRQPVPQALRTP